MKIFCKLGDSSFPVDAEPTTTVGDLKDAIKKKKEHDLAEIDADKLLLVRVYERGKPHTGAKSSAKNKDILKSIANSVLVAASPEETDYEGTEAPGPPEFRSLPGWQFDGSPISAKVMNPGGTCSDYGLERDSAKFTIDILVILSNPEAAPALSAILADDSVLNFWRCLSEVNEIQDAYGNSLLQLPNGVFILGTEILGSAIFVRRCYYELLLSIDIFNNPKIKHCVITGTPGIGKSFFAFYLLWYIKNSFPDSAIVYKVSGPDFVYLFAKDNVFEYSDIASLPRRVLRNGDNFLIVDAHEPPYVAARTILVTSPLWPRFKEYTNKPGVVRRCMPLWSWIEIYSLWCLNYQSVISIELVVELCQKWGMIPRSVLERALDTTYQTDMEGSVKTVNLQALKDSLSRDRYPSDVVSGKILHLLVEPDYCTTTVVFASHYIGDLIVTEYETKNREALYDFIRASRNIGEAAVFRGILFEPLAHKRLSDGGKFKVRQLSPQDQNLDIQIELPKRTCHTFKTLDDLEKLSPFLYYKPLSSNFESIDSIVFPNMLFQVTVGSKHGVKVNGLNQLKNYNILDVESEISLIFVVPEDIYPTFKFQNYTKANDNVGDPPHKRVPDWITSKVQQYVMEMPVAWEV